MSISFMNNYVKIILEITHTFHILGEVIIQLLTYAMTNPFGLEVLQVIFTYTLIWHKEII